MCSFRPEPVVSQSMDGSPVMCELDMQHRLKSRIWL
jgi:hypothetical protein